MNFGYAMLYIAIGITIGIVIGISIGKSSSNNIETTAPVLRPTELSKSLATLIYATISNDKPIIQNNIALRSLEEPSQDIEKISVLLTDGNLTDIEKIITVQNNSIDDINKEIISTSETIKPELVTDPAMLVVIETIKIEDSIAEINDQINTLILTKESLPLIDSSSQVKIDNEITKLQIISNDLNNKLKTKLPLDQALLSVNDPEKVAHLQLIQAKILKKRETKKKKFDEKTKNKLDDNTKEKLKIKLIEKEKQDKDEKIKYIKEKCPPCVLPNKK
jgi:hypothetical protein